MGMYWIGVARYLKSRCDTYRDTRVTIRYVSRYFIDAQTNRVIRLKSKKPQDKRLDSESDQLLCFKTIIITIHNKHNQSIQYIKNTSYY